MDIEKVKKVVSPDLNTRIEIKQKINENAYYIMILLVSVLAIFVPPLVMGSVYGDVGMAFPETVEGWILWSILNGSLSVANISIFVLFKTQAKKNSLKNENFKKAEEIIGRITKQKEVFVPRSPTKMNMQDYTTKLLFIVLGTVMSFIAITSLVLSFDIFSLISTLLSVTITVVMSWFTMLNNEEYWTSEYLMYAEYLEKHIDELEKSKVSTKKVEEGEKENA